MTEKELAEYFEDHLKLFDIEKYIHIPDSVYLRSRGANKLKDIPDYIFPYKGKVYMVELGIGTRHKERKARQMAYMGHWSMEGGVDIQLITSKGHVDIFFRMLKRIK